jgi:hypothetical protein
VDGKERGRPRGDQRFYFLAINIVSLPTDIAKNRSNLLPLQGVRSRDKSERGNYHFPLQFERANGDLERNGRVAHRNAMLNTDNLGDSLFKLLNERTAVRQPMGVENSIHPFKQDCSSAYVRSSDMNFLGKSRLASEDSEFRASTEQVRSWGAGGLA